MKYKGEEYPDQPLHDVCKRDPKTGATFNTSYYNQQCNAVIAYGDHNLTVQGNPKITLINRPEGHRFGNEISFQMNIEGQAFDPYRIDSVKGHKVLEIYLPANERTVDFLHTAVYRTIYRYKYPQVPKEMSHEESQ